MQCTLQLLDHVCRDCNTFSLSYNSLPAGAAHYEKTGESLPQVSLDAARASNAILLSAMGLPHIRKPDGTEIVPQIDLRMELDLFAGVRPVFTFPGLQVLSDERAAQLDFVLIRESIEGLFAHKDEGVVSNNEEATETLRITRKVSEQLFDFSFRLAQSRAKRLNRPGKLMCIDKANVFRSFWFFREIFYERAAAFPDIETSAMYVDAAAMKMVQSPWDFDVMVTENMFGDILSDLGAGIMGSLGLAPSADIGADNAVFQPCHGSAPDIAGQGIANPAAMILSAAMMLEYLGDNNGCDEAVKCGERLRDAVTRAIAVESGRGRDIGGSANTGLIARTVQDYL
ncbi:3-isopropylmalate dehydrogenase [Chromatiales bacterium (ex Bugula neritina AB1)]|nr:3-isopropylmalate dehydrogenase [Chromatiales bacterium (ex Bugula neritina AB1)]